MEKKMLKPGDIGFLMHHDNWISKAIAWFTKSKWSHVFIVLETGQHRVYTVETSDFEVVVHTLEDYINDKNVSFEIYRADCLEEVQRQMISRECLKTLGETYGYLQLISFGIRCILSRYFGIKIHNFFRQGIVCCGVALVGYSKTNIPGLMGIDPESIDSEETYQLICSLKNSQGKLIFEKVAHKDVGELDSIISQ
jgi:hypothetical protein